MGYHRAGFDVVGVDINPQPRYPFTFHQADAMTFPLDGFDAVHASPPCQAYSVSRFTSTKSHPMLIEPMRARLETYDRPYVIENVPGAPLVDPTVLCGTMFGLGVEYEGMSLYLKRHRLFESNVILDSAPACRCSEFRRKGMYAAGVYGHGTNSFSRGRGIKPNVEKRRELMQINWMCRDTLSQSIPPAYSEWIGRQLLEAV